MSQDCTKVNLNRIAARYIVMVIGKKDVGISRQFPHCNYTVGPYGSGPTTNYGIYLYIMVASEYTTSFVIIIVFNYMALRAMCKYYTLLTHGNGPQKP